MSSGGWNRRHMCGHNVPVHSELEPWRTLEGVWIPHRNLIYWKDFWDFLWDFSDMGIWEFLGLFSYFRDFLGLVEFFGLVGSSRDLWGHFGIVPIIWDFRDQAGIFRMFSDFGDFLGFWGFFRDSWDFLGIFKKCVQDFFQRYTPRVAPYVL